MSFLFFLLQSALFLILFCTAMLTNAFNVRTAGRPGIPDSLLCLNCFSGRYKRSSSSELISQTKDHKLGERKELHHTDKGNSVPDVTSEILGNKISNKYDDVPKETSVKSNELKPRKSQRSITFRGDKRSLISIVPIPKELLKEIDSLFPDATVGSPKQKVALVHLPPELIKQLREAKASSPNVLLPLHTMDASISVQNRQPSIAITGFEKPQPTAVRAFSKQKQKLVLVHLPLELLQELHELRKLHPNEPLRNVVVVNLPDDLIQQLIALPNS